MTRTLVAALALVAAPAFAADAPVATLSGQQGTVLVNQGEVFVTAVEGQALNPGDRVLVMAGGEAALAFADGCQLPLAGGSLLEVPAVSTCADGQVAQVQKVGPSYAQAVGDVPHKEPASTWVVFGAGALLIGAAIANDDYSIRPTSP